MRRHSSEAPTGNGGPAHEDAAAQAAPSTASVPRGISEPVPSAGEHELGELLRRLGYHPSDRISVNHKRGSDLVPELVSVDRATETAAEWGDGDVWFGAGPLAATVTRGRGTARDVVGMRTVACDLDYGPDKAGDEANVNAIIEELSAQLGSRPTANVHSGHGQQPHWPVAQDEDTSWPDADDPRHARATAALAGVKALVGSVARQHGAKVDAVFDMARIWRVPGTVNRKEPDAPVPTTVEYPEGSRPLTLAEFEAACATVTPAEPTAKAKAPRAAKVDKADEAEAYDDLDAALQVRVDRWVDAAVTGVDADLHAARDWPAGHRDDHGRGWEKRFADAAHRFGALYRAPWNALTEDEARTAFLAACPTDDGFTAQDARRKWDEQHRRAEPAPWPASLDNDDTGVTFMSGQHQQSATDQGDGQVAGEGTSWALDEAHLADRVAREVLDGRFCWSGALGWMRWDGRRWKASPEAAVIEAVRRYFIKLHTVAARRGAGVDVLKALSSLLWRNRIANVVSLARGIVLVDAASFDQHPDLLNVGNGVVDLRTGELLPHDPALKLTRLTTTHYDPAATHPDWEAAGRSLPDEVLACLQVRMGQAATGHMTPDDVLVVLQGGGQNSKSTLTGAVQASLAEHAVLVSDRLLLASPDAHPTEQMDLRGARFALIEETPEARRLSVARLKKAVGTPLITARRIRADPVTFPATHSLFLTSNYRPQIEETDHGTWRRLALVVFRFTYRAPGEPLRSDTDRHGDPGLRERLLHGQAQHRAVLRWLVDGALAWYAADRVLPPLPALVVADTLAWRTEADHVLGYITECLVIDRDCHVMGTDLLADFNAWAESRGLRPWGDQTLSERFGGHGHVTSAGIEKRRVLNGAGLSRPFGATFMTPAKARAMSWVGVRFRTEADDAQDALQAPWQGWQGSSDKQVSVPTRGVIGTPLPPLPQAVGGDSDEPF